MTKKMEPPPTKFPDNLHASTQRLQHDIQAFSSISNRLFSSSLQADNGQTVHEWGLISLVVVCPPAFSSSPSYLSSHVLQSPVGLITALWSEGVEKATCDMSRSASLTCKSPQEWSLFGVKQSETSQRPSKLHVGLIFHTKGAL